MPDPLGRVAPRFVEFNGGVPCGAEVGWRVQIVGLNLRDLKNTVISYRRGRAISMAEIIDKTIKGAVSK